MIYLSDMPDGAEEKRDARIIFTWNKCYTSQDFEQRYAARVESHGRRYGTEEKQDEQRYRALFLFPPDCIAWYHKESAARNDIQCLEAFRNGLINFWQLRKFIALNNYLPVELVRPEALEKFMNNAGWRHTDNDTPCRL